MGGVDLNTTCTAGELSLVLGITRSSVYDLVGKNVLVRTGSRYPLCENVQRYLQFKIKDIPPEDQVAMEQAKLAAEVRLKEAKAEAARLETDELKGRMHRSEDVEALTSDLIYTIRSAMLALPGRLAVDVAPVDNAAECAVIIRKEIFSAMAGLAEYQYDPAKYAERVRDRLKWEQVMENEPDPTAP